MSELMDHGIIGMPFDMAMSDELSRRQFYDRAQTILAERNQLSAQAEALHQVAHALGLPSGTDVTLAVLPEIQSLLAALGAPDEITAEPAADYDTLRKQFTSLLMLANSKARQTQYWRSKRGREEREALLANAANVNAERDTNAMLTDALEKAEGERDELRKAADQWRALALQFDRHRMTALAHLAAVVDSQTAANIQACQEFLAAAPVSGRVVEQLIAADAIERIVHYVVSKSDQDVLRRIVLEKRREAVLTT